MQMRKWTMRRLLALTLTLLFAHNASAAVSYSTAGSTYTQNFNANNGVPSSATGSTAPNGAVIQTNGSAHIQNGNTPFPGGWKDDSSTNETYLGFPGWYLWHDQIPTGSVYTEVGENSWWSTSGANGHANFRFGGGNATTGTGFFLFSYSLGAEHAMGLYLTNTHTGGGRAYIGLQLVNNTSETLNSFTITYDGEQYREVANANAGGFDLQWSLAADSTNWQSSNTGEGFYNGTSGVDYGGIDDSFKSPINNGTLAAVNGNLAANRVADIGLTINGINWAPGEELWIRWRYQGVYDGIAIDNVRFTASPTVVGPLLADFNSDGKVDAADYVTWRKNEVANATLPNDNGLTDQASRFTLWRANFGNPSGAGSGAGLDGGANVPEPSAIALAVACVAALPFKRNRVR